jgi:hypothetical protein
MASRVIDYPTVGARWAVVILVAMLGHGCAKKPQDSPPPAPERPVQDASRPHIPDAADGPALFPPLKPLAQGKRLRIKSLDEHVEPLEITAPMKFKLDVHGPGEDIGPVAYLSGPDALQITIEEPDEPNYSMAKQKEHLLDMDHATEFVRAEETKDGFLLIALRNANSLEWRNSQRELAVVTGRNFDESEHSEKWEYVVVLWRPKLKVECGTLDAETLSDAELAASICLTLRTAPPKAHK